MSDLISREAAIERATKDHDFYKGATTPADMARRDELLNVMCWLGELPSIPPERKRGKWKSYRCDMYKCSECGYIYTELTDLHRCGAKYCPNCGADMREVDDGSD